MRRLTYPLLIALGIVLIFWKITLSGQFTWMNGDDTVQQVLPWLQMQAREWHRWHFPVLDPFHWAGQSLIGQTQPGAVFPWNWLLFLTPLKNGRLQTGYLNAYFVSLHVLGAWAMFLLLRSLGAVRPLAAVGAVLFGGGGFMATVDWPQMLNGALCMPVVLLFWFRFLRAPGRWIFAALAGAAGGCSILAGHHSAPVVILAAVAGVTAYMLFERRPTRRRLIDYGIGLAWFGLFFFLLGAAQILPAVEYWRVSYRFVNAKEPVTFAQQIPYLIHRHFSFGPASLPGLVVSGFYRDTMLDPFLGVCATALAALGFWVYRTRLYARMALFLVVYSLLLAMGENSLLHGVFFARFPLFDKLRNPSMLVLGIHLALIVLAVYGLEAIRRDRVPREGAVWLVRIGGAAIAVLFALWSVDPAKAALAQGLGQFAVNTLALGCILLVPMAAGRRLVLVAVLTLLETGSNSTKGYPDREMGFANFDTLSRYDDIAAFLKSGQHDPSFRISIDDSVVLKNFGDWYGIRQVNGFMGMSINMFREQWRPELDGLLGARYHVGKEPRRPEQVKRFTGTSGVSVWESPEYAPMAWTAHQFERVNEGQLAERYARGWPAVREPMFALAGAASPAVCPGADEVGFQEIGSERASVEVKMACDGLLVYSSAFLPGWEAHVDGQPAAIIEAYGKLMAVAVPEGTHKVTFRYAPVSVRAGALLSLGGLLALFGWLWISRQRERESRDRPRPVAT